MITLRQRNGWQIACVKQPRGRALRVPLGTKSEAEALKRIESAQLERIAHAAHADALTREVWTRLLAGRNITVREALEAFREHCAVVGQVQTRNHGMLDQWLRHWVDRQAGFAAQSIAIADPRHVAEWVNRPAEVKLRTREWWLAVLSTFFGYCVDQRWIVRNPANEVVVRVVDLTQQQLISQPYVPFSEAEVRTLLQAIPVGDFWHGAVLLAYHYGLRLSSVATLEETNVVAHELRVYTRKGRRMVHERLTDDLIAWLEGWRTHRPASDTPYLFPAQAAIILTGGSVLSDQFRRLCHRHGITGRSFHGLRKTAAQNRWNVELAELGPAESRKLMALVARNGMKKVQELLAHAPDSPVTAAHYFNQQ